MCLNEIYSEVRIGKNLYHAFPIQNGLKQGDVLSSLLFNCALEYATNKVHEKRKTGVEQNTSAPGLCR
jgi:hypothetical protein